MMSSEFADHNDSRATLVHPLKGVKMSQRWFSRASAVHKVVAEGVAPQSVAPLVECMFQNGWMDLSEFSELDVDSESETPQAASLSARVAKAIRVQVERNIQSTSSWYSDLDAFLYLRTGIIFDPNKKNHLELAYGVKAKKTSDFVEEDDGYEDDELDFIRGDKLSGQAPERRQTVFGNFLERGNVGVLAGQPGSGKSLYAMAVALAVASGKKWADDEVGDPAHVIYINNEDDRQEVRRRMLAAAKNHGVDDNTVLKRLYLTHSSSSFSLASSDKELARRHRNKIVAMAKEHNVALIIMDPFAECHDSDESDNGAMSVVVRHARHIARKTNAAVMIIHHVNKGGVPGDMNAIRGASALAGAARACRTLFELSDKDVEGTENIANKNRKSTRSSNDAGINRRIAKDKLRDHIRLDDAKLNYGRKSPYPYLFFRDIQSVDDCEVAVLTPIGLDVPRINEGDEE